MNFKRDLPVVLFIITVCYGGWFIHSIQGRSELSEMKAAIAANDTTMMMTLIHEFNESPRLWNTKYTESFIEITRDYWGLDNGNQNHFAVLPDDDESDPDSSGQGND